MFTGEELDFIHNSPKFRELLCGFSDKELYVFRELLTYICDLTPAERSLLCERIDTELMKLGRTKCPDSTNIKFVRHTKPQ